MDYSRIGIQSPQPQQQRQQEQQKPHDLAQAHSHEAYYGNHQEQRYSDAAAAASIEQYYYKYYPHEKAAEAAPFCDASQGILHRGGGCASVLPGDTQDQRDSHPAPPGLNPAAAAAVSALSQLVRFEGSMDAVERTSSGVVASAMRSRTMPPPHLYEYPMQAGGMRQGGRGRTPNKVSGRGGGPYRAGGNGVKTSFVRRPPQSDGRTPFRGRGQGARIVRGGRRQSHQFAAELQSDLAPSEPMTEPESAETPVSEPAPVLPQQPPLLLAWCDICRVGCNSLDILEQHKNGKRHKKTVQRLEEMQAQQKLLGESQGQPYMQGFDGNQAHLQTTAESQEKVIDQPGGIQEAKLNKIVQAAEEIKGSAVTESFQEASTAENIIETEPQVQDVKQSEVAKTDGYDTNNLPKRKGKRGGRGGKRRRTSESISTKQPCLKEQPRICTLCNVICETQAVFDSHIAGRKHNSRIKRFQRPAAYGSLNVFIPPTQPSIYDPSGPQPLYFGLQPQQMVPLPSYLHQRFLPETVWSHQQEQDGETMCHNEQICVPQGSKNLEAEGYPATTVDVGGQITVSASEVKDTMASGEATGNAAMEAESVFISKEESQKTFEAKDAAEAEPDSAGVIPTPDRRATFGENATPGLDIRRQEPSAENAIENRDTSSH